MTGRLRITRVQVKVEASWDDGDVLTPLDIPAMTVTPADWPGFASGWCSEELARYETQLAEARPNAE